VLSHNEVTLVWGSLRLAPIKVKAILEKYTSLELIWNSSISLQPAWAGLEPYLYCSNASYL